MADRHTAEQFRQALDDFNRLGGITDSSPHRSIVDEALRIAIAETVEVEIPDYRPPTPPTPTDAMVEALKPFAEAASTVDDWLKDDAGFECVFRVGDLRRARAALQHQEPSGTVIVSEGTDLPQPYRPAVIQFEESGLTEFVLRDCATVYDWGEHYGTIKDIETREVIGFVWPTKINPAEVPGRPATPPEPSALDRAVAHLEKALDRADDYDLSSDIIRFMRQDVRAALSAIRGNGGGAEEKVTDSCGCVFCDLNVPKANLKGIAYHEERDGNLIRCEAPDDKR